MAIAFTLPRISRVALALLAFTMMAGARGQDAPAPPAQQPAATPPGQKSGGVGGRAAAPSSSDGPSSPATAEQHRLPPDSTTKQTLALPGRTLNFAATAGSIRLFDDKGEPQADIAYTAYQLDGADPRSRPVTFLFNGGPGAASAYLQFGNAGPWRLAIGGDAAVSSAPPDLMPNAETWLDFTDLVFIDPAGTGYSRFVATGEDVRKRFFSIDERDRADDPPLARKVRPFAVSQIRRRRELWRHPRAEDRSRIADRAGRRGEGSHPGLSGNGFP